MAKAPPDEQHQPFQFRKGVGEFPGFQGVHTRNDPGSVPPHKLRRLVNGRFNQGTIDCRPGHTFSGLDTTFVPRYLGDFHTNQHLWISYIGCAGVSDTGYTLDVYSINQTPQIQTFFQYFAAADRSFVIGHFNGQLYVGDQTALRVINVPYTTGGTNFNDTAGGSEPSFVLHTFSGYAITCMAEFDGKLLIGAQDVGTPANGKIFSYDGLSFATEYTGFCPINMAVFQNTCVAAFDGSVRTRPAGSTTWTNHALAGFTCASFNNAMVQYRSAVWIAGGLTKLYTWDGTTLSAARTIASAGVVADTGINGVCVFQDKLFYVWNDNTNHGATLGRYDGDNAGGATDFVDTYKDLRAQNSHWTYGTAIQGFQRQLFVGTGKRRVLVSPGEDVKGTFTVVEENSPTASGSDHEIHALVIV